MKSHAPLTGGAFRCVPNFPEPQPVLRGTIHSCIYYIAFLIPKMEIVEHYISGVWRLDGLKLKRAWFIMQWACQFYPPITCSYSTSRQAGAFLHMLVYPPGPTEAGNFIGSQTPASNMGYFFKSPVGEKEAAFFSHPVIIKECVLMGCCFIPSWLPWQVQGEQDTEWHGRSMKGDRKERGEAGSKQRKCRNWLRKPAEDWEAWPKIFPKLVGFPLSKKTSSNPVSDSAGLSPKTK